MSDETDAIKRRADRWARRFAQLAATLEKLGDAPSDSCAAALAAALARTVKEWGVQSDHRLVQLLARPSPRQSVDFAFVRWRVLTALARAVDADMRVGGPECSLDVLTAEARSIEQGADPSVVAWLPDPLRQAWNSLRSQAGEAPDSLLRMAIERETRKAVLELYAVAIGLQLTEPGAEVSTTMLRSLGRSALRGRSPATSRAEVLR